ncbi:DUF4830 domain-containing protein [Paenibacillus sp. FSL E2-0201]|uniref:DUF4830 domain-containing protein n=1 Tax=Paenibacillus sp. FSL E2-0201 TaxID=2954726 RepID=UPI0030DACF26
MARRQFIMIVLTCLLLFLNMGCNGGKKASPTIQSSIWKPEVFLQTLDYKVQSQPDKFLVDVPQDWEVKLGEYPEGLYWRLANVFSKDAGFDLTTLKGSDVEAWRYSLVDGLPGSEGLFADAGENGDLASLGHFELLDAFFQAIQEGNHTRARACLNPNALLTALTVNRQAYHLYNSGFGGENALSESIVEAKPNAYKVMDYDSGSEIKDIGDRTTINVVVDLYMKSLNPVFDTPDGQETRFAVLTKHDNGWKIGELGTGP